MKNNLIARPLIMLLFVVGLMAGCASTPDETSGVADQATAEKAIADAKTANAEAKKMGHEWRDTGKMIKQAEDALAAGDYQKAIDIADKARRQGENAQQQAREQDAKLNAEFGLTSSGAEMSASEDSANMTGSAGMVDSYQVVGGDNLWNISGKNEVYANPYEWPLIYKANRDKIKDADLIYPGQVFDIDRSASASDIDAAVQHAKTRGAWSVGTVEASDKAYLGE